eukprot:COSAG01_NODE_1997_length_8691_cov_5.509777_5_plen_76_part_00
MSLQPARLCEFNNRILCRDERFYAHWLAKSVTAAVDGGGRRLKPARRRLHPRLGRKELPRFREYALWGRRDSDDC